MFHLQKNSSQANIQNEEINLLQSSERISKINFLRANQMPNNNSNTNQSSLKTYLLKNRTRKRSHQVRPLELHRASVSIASENMQVQQLPTFMQGGGYGMGSQSILTESSSNTKIIGLILFLILLLFTPLEIVSLSYSIIGSFDPIKSNQGNRKNLSYSTALELLLCAQMISFALLYYFEWIQKFALFKNIYKAYHNRNLEGKQKRFLHPLNNPYILTLLIVIFCFLFELCYIEAFLTQASISLLILYITILPQISVGLLFEDELFFQSSISTSKIFYCTNIFLLCTCFFSQGIYTLLACLSSMMLIYLNLRVGREWKFSLLLIVVVRDIMIVNKNQQKQASFGQFALWLILIVVSLLIVRYMINKILRNQLYKYFYSDAEINCALLCIPIFLEWLNNTMNYYSILGCLFLAVICYKIGRDKAYVSMGS